MIFRRAIAAVAAAGIWLPGASAWAQTALPLRPTLDDPAAEAVVIPDPNLIRPEELAPRRRKTADDPYAPQGIKLGSITIYPSIGIGSLATSNVQGSASNAQSDIGLMLRPMFRAESNWMRHQWTAGASGDFTFYGDNSDLNGRDFNLFQRLRLDIRRGTTGVIESSYVQDQAGIEDSDVPATAVGYRTEQTLASSATLAHDFGGIEARMKGGAAWNIFDDVALSGGGTEDNTDRNYVEPMLSFRTTLTDPPVFKPYIEASYAPRIHELTVDRNGLRRDSNGYGLSAGVTIDNGPMWTGDLALTYLRRDYDDPALKGNDAIGLNGNLTWNPSELTRIVLDLGTSLLETSSATSSGSRNWTISVAANRAIRENIDVSAGAGAEIEKNDGGTDVTYDANLGLSWKLNPVLTWTAGYDLTWLDAGTGGRSYAEHRVSTGVTLSR